MQNDIFHTNKSKTMIYRFKEGIYYPEKIIIPDKVTIIENQAFKYCSTLKNVYIPDTIKEIGNWVFYGCKSLRKISIPNTAIIGKEIFSHCYSLKTT